MAAASLTDLVEQFVDRRLRRFVDEMSEEVLLKRLPRGRGTPPQFRVDLVGDVLHLNAWHAPHVSANMALMAPN
jgi:hypothetical protein